MIQLPSGPWATCSHGNSVPSCSGIGLTLALFIAVLIGVEILLGYLTAMPWPWAETLTAIGAGLCCWWPSFS